MRLALPAFAAAVVLTLTLMASLAWEAAQHGALPLLPQEIVR